jgi:hypothetical protein
MTGQGTRAVSTNFGGGSCATVTLKGSRWLIAVFAFYTLSGFLLTRLHNERYGFSMRGPAGFLLNRVLRLWPAYLAILGHLRRVAVRYRATTARATSHQTAGRIVFPTQNLGDTLAVHGRMFRARRVEEIHADGLSGLRLPILAALVFGKMHPLIGACSHVDDTEDRRPRLSSFGDDRKDDRNLIGSYFGRGDGKRSGEQIPGEFKTHPANTSQPFVRASVTPRSSYSLSEWSLRSRAASAFSTTFQ